MQVSYYTALAAIGALWSLKTASYYASKLWIFAKPSHIHRYLHTTNGKPAWALITGGAGGIGMALAHELATLGFNIVLHGRNQEKLDKAGDELQASHTGREFRTLVIDAQQAFASADSCRSWVESLQDLNVTVLINAAGGATENYFAPLDKLSTRRLVDDTSLNAVFPALLLHEMLPLLERNGPGLVINLGSIADEGLAHLGTYPASKRYLSKVTETVGRELKCKGRDIEIFLCRMANVAGTPQSSPDEPPIFSPSTASMARAIIARVGCGRYAVEGHWRHALQISLFELLPGFVAEHFLEHAMEHRTLNKTD